MTDHHHTPNVFRPTTTKKDRAAQYAAYAQLVRWCRAHRAEHTDACGEVDLTALASACADAHGCDDPGADHPAWDAAAEATS